MGDLHPNGRRTHPARVSGADAHMDRLSRFDCRSPDRLVGYGVGRLVFACDAAGRRIGNAVDRQCRNPDSLLRHVYPLLPDSGPNRRTCRRPHPEPALPPAGRHPEPQAYGALFPAAARTIRIQSDGPRIRLPLLRSGASATGEDRREGSSPWCDEGRNFDTASSAPRRCCTYSPPRAMATSPAAC